MIGGYRRFFAFWLDVFLVSIVVIPIWMILFFNAPIENLTFDQLSQRFYPLLGIACVYAVLKDVFGRSIGKVLLGLYIKSDDGSSKIPVLKRILRNITMPIWPIEALFITFSKDNRRITDRMLHLHVEHSMTVRQQRGHLR